MKALNLEHIERELKKRHQFPYQWLRRQNDEWDQNTKFIYQITNWEDLREKILNVAEARPLDNKAIFQYASIRWYNFWSAKAVEQIFMEMEEVEPVANPKDPEKDFFLHGIPFDHKTSVFPEKFGKNFEYAKNHKAELIEWLYLNQSQQQRHHLKNRLFIVVYADNGEHWKLKAEIGLLKKVIQKYVSSFNPERLHSLNLMEGRTTLGDIIWACR